MSERNTFSRSLHDVGLAAWFGGSLMGIIGLNRGASAAKSPTERLRLSSIGWRKWQPWQNLAILAHLIGGAGVTMGNTGRLAVQPEGRQNTYVKLALLGLSLVATFAAATIGRGIGKRSEEGAEGVTEPDTTTSPELASRQRAQRVVQWMVPALTGTMIVLGAQQGEQQRPAAGFMKVGRRRR